MTWNSTPDRNRWTHLFQLESFVIFSMLLEPASWGRSRNWSFRYFHVRFIFTASKVSAWLYQHLHQLPLEPLSVFDFSSVLFYMIYCISVFPCVFCIRCLLLCAACHLSNWWMCSLISQRSPHLSQSESWGFYNVSLNRCVFSKYCKHCQVFIPICCFFFSFFWLHCSAFPSFGHYGSQLCLLETSFVRKCCLTTSDATLTQKPAITPRG